MHLLRKMTRRVRTHFQRFCPNQKYDYLTNRCNRARLPYVMIVYIIYLYNTSIRAREIPGHGTVGMQLRGRGGVSPYPRNTWPLN